MIQDQLVDYISSQMKLGVSREAIKSALVSAGWVAADVEDTLKKLEGSAPAQTGGMANASAKTVQISGGMTSGAMSGIGGSGVSAAKAASPSGMSSSSPQMIRVSDLVSASASISPSTSTSASPSSTMTGAVSVSKGPAKADLNKFEGKIKGNTFEAMASASGKPGIGGLILKIVCGVVILALAGLAWYFYSENEGLAAKVASLNNQSASVNSQLSTLQSQLTASSTSMAAEISSLTDANADLALNLSFYAAPLGATATTTPVKVGGSISSGGKTGYLITTPRGAKVAVASGGDANVMTQLKSFVGDTVTITGTYIPGSDMIMVASVIAPAGDSAATSTSVSASSTAP